ncbi:MAG: hypothetical protein ACJASQ_003061 [Crocinitomicaceae bacterium]|jgi:hypothetical protein
MKKIISALFILMGMTSPAQDCKPYKKIKDGFLNKQISTYGAKIGTERSMLLGVTATSYVLATKTNDSTYSLIFNMQYYQKGNDASVNDIHYPTGTVFDLRTAQGVKAYTSETARNMKRKVSSKILSICELVVTVSKKDIEYLRDNALLAYRITPHDGSTTQGTVDEKKALKLQLQMNCLLNGKAIDTSDTDSINELPKPSEILKIKESSTTQKNELNIMIGNSVLDYIDEGNIRLAFVGSYSKRIHERISVGFHFGVTRSTFSEEESDEDYEYNPQTGGYEWQTTTRDHTYKTHRFFIGPKVNVIAYKTDKFQVYGSAGVSIARFRDVHDKLTIWDDGDTKLSHDLSKKIVFNYDLYAGASYFFNQHLGVTATVGIGISRFRLGLSYRY